MMCAAEGCETTDEALFRVNPKGEPGIFMCREHAQFVNSWEQRLTEPVFGDRRRSRGAGVEPVDYVRPPGFPTSHSVRPDEPSGL